jgi:hypothetical protein
VDRRLLERNRRCASRVLARAACESGEWAVLPGSIAGRNLVTQNVRLAEERPGAATRLD